MSECPCGGGEITLAGYARYGNAAQEVVWAECTCGGQWVSNVSRRKFLGKCEENSCDADDSYRLPAKFCKVGGRCDKEERSGGESCEKWKLYEKLHEVAGVAK